ncbi:pyrroline-5-carboxylate reductase [Phenylobacterium hankyongense]|uniref:Pyrroline-5-carboxylate reductase n=1 Tax=Phenylobacterium hankyongense TaxID=1813876 RepID=A0A328B179_9CAUL|nr:pyrroline-5-carboxylate reductase [Phenylobacterium hankyongense]RAK60211.1 pyrroline-5-carboxylate reductase [Phenylobacterium hankyongense]
MPGSRVLIGCGRMGQALLAGWTARGETAFVIDPSADRAALAALGAVVIDRLDDLAAVPKPLCVLVAVKPADAQAAIAGLAPWLGPGDLVVSVAAGVPIAALRRALGAAQPGVVRAMPNIAASAGAAMTAAVAEPGLDAGRRGLCESLFTCVGEFVWLADEPLLDAATAISGSGLAYVFSLGEQLAQAGVALGLADDVAARLARVTLSGAGALAARGEASLAELRAQVTSPSGTTAAALAVLDGPGGLGELIARATTAAARRAAEMTPKVQ